MQAKEALAAIVAEDQPNREKSRDRNVHLL